MKIYIRYFRNFAFGNYATLNFDVDSECLVLDLKKQIFARLRVEVKHQQLCLKNFGQIEIMTDQCSLSFYNVKEGTQIFLENLGQKQQESDVRITHIYLSYSLTLMTIFLNNVVVNQRSNKEIELRLESKVSIQTRSSQKHYSLSSD